MRFGFNVTITMDQIAKALEAMKKGFKAMKKGKGKTKGKGSC
jgi:hypothetical protein